MMESSGCAVQVLAVVAFPAFAGGAGGGQDGVSSTMVPCVTRRDGREHRQEGGGSPHSAMMSAWDGRKQMRQGFWCGQLPYAQEMVRDFTTGQFPIPKTASGAAPRRSGGVGTAARHADRGKGDIDWQGRGERMGKDSGSRHRGDDLRVVSEVESRAFDSDMLAKRSGASHIGTVAVPLAGIQVQVKGTGSRRSGLMPGGFVVDLRHPGTREQGATTKGCSLQGTRCADGEFERVGER